MQLPSRASAQDIHKAAVQLNDLIFRASRTSERLEAPREEYSEQLFANLVLTRAIPDKANLRKVQAALHSETASKLAKYYVQRMEEFVRSNHAGIAVDPLISQYTHYSVVLDQLRRAVDQLCDGIQSADRPIEVFGGHVDVDFAPEIKRAVEEAARQN